MTPTPTRTPRAFTPKLLDVLREGYDGRALRADLIAGLTVAIVALPLSMAIAIASGVSPERGLFTAIVGGFLVSALGGSRFQIGGPAGAFVVLVAATVTRHGIDGLLLATALSGLFLIAAGFLRLGAYVRYTPFPVTVGFTAGVAAIIALSQISSLFGLSLDAPEPAAALEKIPALADAADTISPAAAALGFGVIALILALRRWAPNAPGMLIAVVAAALFAALAGLPVETVGDRFGAMPNTPPAPSLPTLSLEKLAAVLPDAGAFALLGAIESLLSATVADNMTGRRHRADCELIAQGAANIGAALFGGFCVTGAIARTATNVRAGAHGPIAGMIHALILLVFLAIAAPLAERIPLAALAGLLLVVAWSMIEREAIRRLFRASYSDALVLLATFLLTVFHDLTEAIIVGVALGGLSTLRRLAQSFAIEHLDAEREEDATAADQGVIVYRVRGALFFGAAGAMETAFDRLAGPERFLLDLSAMPFLDSTGAEILRGLLNKAVGAGAATAIIGADPSLRAELQSHGLGPDRIAHHATLDEAMRQAPDKTA